MKNLTRSAIFFALCVFPGSRWAFCQMVEENLAEQWVEFHDGEISVAFQEAPVNFALSVFRARTGFQIDIPNLAENRLVNLRLDRLPLEPAVRSVIFSIGFKNFALMYDDNGRPNRAVVLNARADSRPELARGDRVGGGSSESMPPPLTSEERDRIHKELERWKDLSKEERGRIEDRLKILPASEDRESLVREYGRRILGIEN